MAGYGQVGAYGELGYKQDVSLSADTNFAIQNKINAVTGRCIRFAVKPDQGQGYSVYKNSAIPNAWIWPEPQSVPITVYDGNRHARHLVLDEKTGRWYEIGTRNGPANSNLIASYLDKDAEDYSGTEIPCEAQFREDIARNEHMKIEHIENHQYVRPQNKNNQGASGYNAFGLRPQQEIEIDIYRDGVLVEFARTRDVPIGGDYVFDRRTRGNRLRIGFKTATSEFRLTSNDRYYLQIDENATRKEMTEREWQEELMNDLGVWISRGADPTTNLGNGTTMSGGFDSVTQGPDGIDNSALSFSPSSGLSTAISGAGDYTFIFTVSNIVSTVAITDNISIVRSGDNYRIHVTNNSQTVNRPLNWDGSGWVTIAVKRSGGFIYISEDGGASDITPIGDNEDLSGTLNICNGQDCDLFDFRYYQKQVSDAALDYYYKDLTEYDGKALLPIW